MDYLEHEKPVYHKDGEEHEEHAQDEYPGGNKSNELVAYLFKTIIPSIASLIRPLKPPRSKLRRIL